MLRDVLVFVRSSMWGRIRVKRRHVDLQLVCERVLDAIQRRHPDRLIVLSSRTRVDGEWDPDLVVTLLSNLIVNALEHGAASKAIRIKVSAVGDSAVIEVASAGPALDEEVVGRLFEPFNCGRPKHSEGHPEGREGLGFGLYLANEIARAHLGRIDALSDPAGRDDVSRDDAALLSRRARASSVAAVSFPLIDDRAPAIVARARWRGRLTPRAAGRWREPDLVE